MRYKSSKKTRQKRKIRNARKDIPFVLPCSNHCFLNYAPKGAICTRSLENKLSDSLRLIICAGSTSWAECREANLSRSAK